MMITFLARGIADSTAMLDQVAERLGDDGLEELLPGVLEIQKDWWGALGRGSWDGHELEVTGALRAAATEEGAAGQRVRVSGDELVFGLAGGGPGDPGFYGAVQAGRGFSAIVDPEDPDAERLAEAYAIVLLERHG